MAAAVVPTAIVGADGNIVALNELFADATGLKAGGNLSAVGVVLADWSRDGRYRRVEGEGSTAFTGLLSIRPFEPPPAESVVVAIPDAMLCDEELELRELARFPLANPSPVLRVRNDDRIIACNPAAEKLFGDKDLALAKWTEICPGVGEDFWNEVLESDRTRSLEVKVGDDTVRFDHVRSASGKFISVFGFATTEFRRMEHELAENAKQLSEMARFPDMNPGPVIRTNWEGEILLANAAARSLFGDDLMGKDWRQVCPKVTLEHWMQIIESDDPIEIEGRVSDHDFVFNHRSDGQSGMVFVYGTDVTRQKQAEQALRQSEKMATLGTLSAGVTHELNNPAAATRRAAEQLRDKLPALDGADAGFAITDLPEEHRDGYGRLIGHVRAAALDAGELDPIERSDRESEIEDWLDENNVDDPWELAGDLVAANLKSDELAFLAEVLDASSLNAALARLTAIYNVASLANTISEGATRLSEIVGALKGYSYLGQAPAQEVDLSEGIDNTLIILRAKLKYGITVHRDYADDMPRVPAYGSELNQVWTNIIDNAADAMGEKGTITIRTRVDGEHAIVEIEDDGPGIPPDIKDRLFDPFFTTKPPGKGMGLGLSTTYSIVTEKHRGEIEIDSKPGATRFIVRLPLTAPSVTT